MRILECPLLKNRVALGCIGLLGLSTCSGLIHTSVSSGFSKTLNDLFSRLGGASGTSTASQESGAGEKISPVRWMANTGDKVWKDYLTPFVNTTYKWITTKEKRESVWGVLKKFWNYGFFKGLMSKLPWIVWSWVYIFSRSDIRSKFLLAWKHSLHFFDAVVKSPQLKKYSSHFCEIFAELLFVPIKAIRKFAPRLGRQREGCPSYGNGRGDSVSQGGETICMSVTWENKAEKK